MLLRVGFNGDGAFAERSKLMSGRIPLVNGRVRCDQFGTSRAPVQMRAPFSIITSRPASTIQIIGSEQHRGGPVSFAIRPFNKLYRITGALVALTIAAHTGVAQQMQIPIQSPPNPTFPNVQSRFPPCMTTACATYQDLGGGTLYEAGVFNNNLLIPPGAATGSLTAAGTQAYGYGAWGYFPCANLACQPDGGVLAESWVGGEGYQSATTSFAGKGPGAAHAPFQMFFAQANLYGPLGTPVLHAMAQSQETMGQAPGYSSNCCFYYNSQAIATAMQWYQYTGTTPGLFTISYAVDAFLDAYHDQFVDYRPNASVSGGIAIWDGVVPPPPLGLEFPLGSSLGFSNTVLDGGMPNVMGIFTGTGSVTFSVQPGAGFFLSAFLTASAPQYPGYIISDAMNTMSTSFTAGNTSLLVAGLPGLTPQTSVVPEPSTYALMAFGLFSLVAAGRLRKGKLV